MDNLFFFINERRPFPDTFIGAQLHSRPGPPCWLLPLGKYLSFVLQLLYIHLPSLRPLRPSLIRLALSQCLIFPITTATIFIYRGYGTVTAVSAVQK